MNDEFNLSRRALFPFLTGVSLLAQDAVAQPISGSILTGQSDTLVAWHSRSGNTRVIAGIIQRALKSDQYEILPRQPYPADYLEMVEQASNERKSGFNPPLLNNLADLKKYKTVYLGYPIWGMSLPSIMRSFLVRHDLSGINIIPFITHGGYGIGDSLDILAKSAAGATISAPFIMQADQERQTMEKTLGWLEFQARRK
ncbi:MAG: flavodoxin [Pantoea sp.]|uniref:flavodoxin n=1 Tax=Pantoea sp. TaxID=69393 RepID=UPI0023979BE5|nr:flavodoxin [Pantoea sp.]MDE1188155.1 flavodoxin [Pantoea sp.]